jgi:hypothetical protein
MSGDQAQGLRSLVDQIKAGGDEVEGAHGRLILGVDQGSTRGSYSETAYQWADGIWRENPDPVSNSIRVALVNLLAADKRLVFQMSGDDKDGFLSAMAFQKKAMEAAETALEAIP